MPLTKADVFRTFHMRYDGMARVQSVAVETISRLDKETVINRDDLPLISLGMFFSEIIELYARSKACYPIFSIWDLVGQ